MGRDYIFYPAFRDAETKKIRPLLFEDNGEPASIMWRSSSFIDGDYFIENFPMTTKEDYEEKYQSFFCDGYTELSENAPTYVYEISEDRLYSIGDSDGLINGYALLEDMEMYYASEYPQEYFYWEMRSPISAELYAELPESKQNKYGRFATIDRYSAEYICGHLAEILEDIFVPWDKKGEKIILMVYSF